MDKMILTVRDEGVSTIVKVETSNTISEYTIDPESELGKRHARNSMGGSLQTTKNS
jgi:hypothetical protein